MEGAQVATPPHPVLAYLSALSASGLAPPTRRDSRTPAYGPSDQQVRPATVIYKGPNPSRDPELCCGLRRSGALCSERD